MDPLPDAAFPSWASVTEYLLARAQPSMAGVATKLDEARQLEVAAD